jgi:hypothetical protein
LISTKGNFRPISAGQCGRAGTSEISRESLVNSLTGFTEQGNRVAQGLETRQIGLNVLGDELFAKAYRGRNDPARVRAFQRGEFIYIRRSSARMKSDIIHEGTHVLDEAQGSLPSYGLNPYIWEKRAYFYERQFQVAEGGNPEFLTIESMLDHIWMNYSPR